MTPSPTPIIDLTTGVAGIIKAFNGGTVTQIIAAVFILIVLGLMFFFKSEINTAARDAAKRQTEIDAEMARLAAIVQARKQEEDAQTAQDLLKNGEKAHLAKFLTSLDDVTLVLSARKAYGDKAVDLTSPSATLPLSSEQRQGLYKLYGV